MLPADTFDYSLAAVSIKSTGGVLSTGQIQRRWPCDTKWYWNTTSTIEDTYLVKYAANMTVVAS